MIHKLKTLTSIVLLILVAGCASSRDRVTATIMRNDDLVLQKYETIGILQVSRETFGHDIISSDDRTWAEKALLAEAAKIGADAVTTPEISIHSEKLLLIPVTEIRARALAVKFR